MKDRLVNSKGKLYDQDSPIISEFAEIFDGEDIDFENLFRSAYFTELTYFDKRKDEFILGQLEDFENSDEHSVRDSAFATTLVSIMMADMGINFDEFDQLSPSEQTHQREVYHGLRKSILFTFYWMRHAGYGGWHDHLKKFHFPTRLVESVTMIDFYEPEEQEDDEESGAAPSLG
ncbi:MAG: hypothetical protein GYB68_19655 [Chloroflexi bacterium]|nr:hypothetical protein [Chloroflexota bacterium]